MKCISGAFAGYGAALSELDGQWVLRSGDETLVLEQPLSFEVEAAERVPSPQGVLAAFVLILIGVLIDSDVELDSLGGVLFLVGLMKFVASLQADSRIYVAIRSSDRLVTRARVFVPELKELGRATSTATPAT